MNDEQRQRIEKLLHEGHVLLSPRIQECFAVEQSLLDPQLGKLRGEGIVVSQDVDHVSRALVDQAEDDVHDLDRRVHGVREAAPVVVHRVTEEEQDRLVLLHLLPVAGILQDRLEVADIRVQVPDDDELPLFGSGKLDQPSREAVGCPGPQGLIDRQDVLDRIAKHFHGGRSSGRRLSHGMLLQGGWVVMGQW